jgi:anthranilate synthase component 1
MFYFDFGDCQLVGASPEILVRREGDKVTLRPIAGTRKRGATPERDLEMERELVSDPKERAEHLMLIDLGAQRRRPHREDRHVKVTETMVVERYSHVMHMVSNVEGTGGSGAHADAAPPGHLSGGHRDRHAQGARDGNHPGARARAAQRVRGGGRLPGFSGNIDLAIAIRTGVIKDRELHVQAAAGVVADSIDDNEWRETQNKARALLAAAELVHAGLDSPDALEPSGDPR